MADTKISALTAGAPALGTDQFPAARSGTNVKLLVSDLATFIRTNNVLSQTLAQAQSNNGTYTKGSWVQVTEDIGGITGSADTIFPVIEGGFLAGTGWCQTFENTGMAASRMVEISWELGADFVSAIEEPIQGNTVTAFYNTSGLENFPFDTTTIKQTTIIDPFVCAIDVAAQVYAATFEGNNSIIIEAGATFSGKAGREAVVALSDTSFFTGEVGANGGVTLFGTQALNWCKIGANKNVDCSSIDSGYGQTGKVYDGDYSTFVITSTDSAAVNPAGGKTIDMSDFPFAGVLVCDSNADPLQEFVGFPVDHKWKVNTSIPNFHIDFYNNSGSGTNIYANTKMVTAVDIDINPGDYLEFLVNSNNASFVNAIIIFQQ